MGDTPFLKFVMTTRASTVLWIRNGQWSRKVHNRVWHDDGCLLALTLATSVSYVSLFVWLEIHCCFSTASSTHCQIVSTPSSWVTARCQFILFIIKKCTFFTSIFQFLVTREMGSYLNGDQIVKIYMTSQWSEIEELGSSTSIYPAGILSNTFDRHDQVVNSSSWWILLHHGNSVHEEKDK